MALTSDELRLESHTLAAILLCCKPTRFQSLIDSKGDLDNAVNDFGGIDVDAFQAAYTILNDPDPATVAQYQETLGDFQTLLRMASSKAVALASDDPDAGYPSDPTDCPTVYTVDNLLV
jgi:hypothetical protein